MRSDQIGLHAKSNQKCNNGRTADRMAYLWLPKAIMPLIRPLAKSYCSRLSGSVNGSAMLVSPPLWRRPRRPCKTARGIQSDPGGRCVCRCISKTILIGVAVVAVSFLISLKAMDWLAPRGTVKPPALVELPPLPPAPRSSIVMAPIAVALSAIRDAADRGSPRILQRQGRKSGLADPAERRHRLDRLARADHGNRRAGCADAGDAADRNAQCHGLAVGESDRRRRRRARRPARRQCRQTDRQREHQEPQRQRRDQGQCRHHRAAEDRRQLAHRAQSRRAGQSRRHQPYDGRRPHQRAGAGQAGDRQDRRRSDQPGAGADAQRSRLRTERAGAMDQGLPLDPAAGHRRQLVAAGAVAGDAADPGDRRPTAHRCAGADADARHRGRDPHHAGRDQAQLPVPRHHRHRAADAGTGRDRRARRHALHRDQQDRRGAVCRKDVSGGRLGLGRRHREARHASRPPATAC